MKLTRHSWIIAAGAVAVTVLTGCSNDATHGPAAAAPTTSPAVTSPATTAPTTTAPTTAAPTATTSATKKPTTSDGARLGAIISTGMDVTPITEWVIYGEAVKNKNSPDTTFGFVLAERTNQGKVTKYSDISESFKPELAAGFHVPERAYSLDNDIEQPAFGYFVGTPAKITGTVDGKTMVAKTAKWSKNTKVTVFWFDNTKVTGNTKLTTVHAYNAAGKQTAQAPVYGME